MSIVIKREQRLLDAVNNAKHTLQIVAGNLNKQLHLDGLFDEQRRIIEAAHHQAEEAVRIIVQNLKDISKEYADEEEWEY